MWVREETAVMSEVGVVSVQILGSGAQEEPTTATGAEDGAAQKT